MEAVDLKVLENGLIQAKKEIQEADANDVLVQTIDSVLELIKNKSTFNELGLKDKVSLQAHLDFFYAYSEDLALVEHSGGCCSKH